MNKTIDEKLEDILDIIEEHCDYYQQILEHSPHNRNILKKDIKNYLFKK